MTAEIIIALCSGIIIGFVIGYVIAFKIWGRW